jgi:hypothetical protein
MTLPWRMEKRSPSRPTPGRTGCDGLVGDVRVAHPAHDLEHLLEVQFLLGPDHVDVARQVRVFAAAPQAGRHVARLVERRAVGFAQQARGRAALTEVDADRAAGSTVADALVNGLLNHVV